MVRPEAIFDALRDQGAQFFTGVPDSLLKDLCSYIANRCDPSTHIIAVNEGCAVGLATGHFLATGRPAVVYLQNSGLGNAINPLLSLVDPAVYGIPMLLIIGWRGEPGVADEPQHCAQGPATIPLLNALGIPSEILPEDESTAAQLAAELYKRAAKEGRPLALVVRAKTFTKEPPVRKRPCQYPLSREAVLAVCVSSLPRAAVTISTTGKLSQELFAMRAKAGDHGQDFLSVGAMGHASQIALGIALAQPTRPVYCFDGDGAALMHLGAWAAIGQFAPRTYRHIIFNNGAHESVGGQPTLGFEVDFVAIALGCGYRFARSVSQLTDLQAALAELETVHGPALLEIRVNLDIRPDLARPTRTPSETKWAFMQRLGSLGASL
ncbi:phosphonopyruvate decarboxylase [Candidatus Kaiserbacteria bacterium]|nr:phosphonopyruvate decarboxylase [Candidatus Kaiserbacteria bacterium]